MFVLQAFFLFLLGTLVVAAWPKERKIDISNPTSAQQLVELFFAGQFLLASLTAPAFAAGSLTGEKERKTYEMLLASALRPRTIVIGKWMASFLPSLLMVLSSLPIVMLCLPLGGISFYEAAAAYVTLIASLACFTLVGLYASAYFARTIAALIASYFVVLPLTLIGLTLWITTGSGGSGQRLFFFFGLVPLLAVTASAILFSVVCNRLWYPPDVGSEGREVIDEQQELRDTIGLVIRRDEFPDRLFAPAKRTEPLADGANPVLDKELRSELFSQGTLMLRMLVQISLLTAVPIMGACLFLRPSWAPWYLCYVLAFNLLVGPAFSAGSIANERERRTLDLLLATTLPSSSILWGKLLSGLRVSGVLTSFLMWPVVLACALMPEYYPNIGSFLAMALVVALSCVLTSTLSLFCSVWYRRSGTSLTTAYLMLAAAFWLMPAAAYFFRAFFPDSPVTGALQALSITSPATAMFSLPLTLPAEVSDAAAVVRQDADWPIFVGHIVFQIAAIAMLLLTIERLFERRYGAA